MSLWESYPGKWLADQLEAGAVLARARLEAGAGDAGPVLSFSGRLLAEVFPKTEWWREAGRRRLIRLSVASHGEELELELQAPPTADVWSAEARIAGPPERDTVLRDPKLVGTGAVLALLPGSLRQPLRGRLWIARDGTEDADIEEAFDQDGWGGLSAQNTILRWTR